MGIGPREPKRTTFCARYSWRALADSMHKNGYRRAHGRLRVIGLERMDSRVVDLPVGLCLEYWEWKMTCAGCVENKGRKLHKNWTLKCCPGWTSGICNNWTAGITAAWDMHAGCVIHVEDCADTYKQFKLKLMSWKCALAVITPLVRTQRVNDIPKNILVSCLLFN